MRRMQPSDERKKPDRLTLLLRVLLVLAAALAILLVVLRFEDIRANGFAETFFGPSEADSPQRVETLDFTANTLNTYSAGNDGLLVLSPSGAYLVGYDGERVFDIAKAFRKPAIAGAGDYRFAYDAGGSNMLYMQKGKEPRELVSDSPIISAAINAKGSYLVLADESGAKVTARLCDADDTVRYVWYSSERYLLGGDIYSDGTHFVLNAVKQEDARIISSVMLFDVTKDEPVAVRDFYDHLVLKVRCLDAGHILALCETEAVILDAKSGEDVMTISYGGASLLDVITGNGFFAMRLSAGATGEQSNIETYSFEGVALGSLSVRGIVSLDAADGYLGVLTNDSFVVYNSKLESESGGPTVGGARRLIMRGGRRALILTSQSAVGYEF